MAAREIYLDHASTTPLDPEVADLIAKVQTDCFANPSSPHAAGRRARRIVDETREQVLADLGAPQAQLVFTSGATEANALAVYGLTAAHSQQPAAFACSARDHESLRALAVGANSGGCQRTLLPLERSGRLSQTAVTQWLTTVPDSNKSVVPSQAESSSPVRRLLSATLVCGQTGTVEDLTGLVDLIRQTEPGCRLHTDATQAIGRLPINLATMETTSLAFAAHKIGGPRGIGCLIFQPEQKLVPLLPGTQQLQQRGGTEPVALIAGCGLAVRQAIRCQQIESERLLTLQRQLETGLLQAAQQAGLKAQIVGETTPRSPHLTTIAVPGFDRQAFVLAADLAGLAIATGTACASGSSEPSPALVAMNLDPAIVQSSIRVSLGRNTTSADVDEAIGRMGQLFLQFTKRTTKG
jgi:cysteine desulfurase